MCGRTAMNFTEDELRAELARANVRVNQVRNEPVWRRTFNVAPTYNQPVIRQLGEPRDAPSHSQPPADGAAQSETHPATSPRKETNKFGNPGDVIVQSMRWGLIPFWTKRNPDYPSILRTINCRDDSLIEGTGMWNSIKGRKRCVIPVMGYYEWLKKGKDKIPHFTKRADGKIMLLAGLWDSVRYEGAEETLYTYTIITTSSAKSVSFLHDRMPVILDPDSEALKRWLDPNEGWSMELSKILRPYEGELLCYPVKKEVGKVGEDSPLFVVPLDSAENKSNIANYFSKPKTTVKPKVEEKIVKEAAVDENAGGDLNSESHAPGVPEIVDMASMTIEATTPVKRKLEEDDRSVQSAAKTPMRKPTKRAPPSTKKSPVKAEPKTKITNFFPVK